MSPGWPTSPSVASESATSLAIRLRGLRCRGGSWLREGGGDLLRELDEVSASGGPGCPPGDRLAKLVLPSSVGARRVRAVSKCVVVVALESCSVAGARRLRCCWLDDDRAGRSESSLAGANADVSKSRRRVGFAAGFGNRSLSIVVWLIEVLSCLPLVVLLAAPSPFSSACAVSFGPSRFCFSSGNMKRLIGTLKPVEMHSQSQSARTTGTFHARASSSFCFRTTDRDGHTSREIFAVNRSSYRAPSCRTDLSTWLRSTPVKPAVHMDSCSNPGIGNRGKGRPMTCWAGSKKYFLCRHLSM